MATRSTSTPLTTGPAAAAVLSAGLGLLALGIAQVLSEISEPFKHAMQTLGSLWIPGALGIGPYSGKETAALIVWLTSWLALYLLLRRRDVSLIAAGVVALGLVGVATTLLWPPVTRLFVP